MTEEQENPAPGIESIGLCASCRHRRTQGTARGAVFHRCTLADEDHRYQRYPPLPVRRCAGFADVDLD